MSSELIVMNRLKLPVFQNEYLAKSVRKIIECSRNIIANHFQIAYELASIKKLELYKEAGYESVTDFAEKVFGFSKTSTSLAIKVAERYLIDEGDRIATTFLDTTGTDFSFNQLRETLPLSERKVNLLVFNKKLKPTMTVKQIRTLVQEEKNKGNNQSFDVETEENRGINLEVIDISASLSSSSVEPAEVSTESVNSSSDSLVSSEESDNLSEEHELKSESTSNSSRVSESIKVLLKAFLRALG